MKKENKTVHLLEAAMKYLKQMKQLTRYFKKDVEIETSIASLAEVLNCSERHVKTIVNYLAANHFIEWKTQRGRGKKPRIRLLYNLQEIELAEAKQFVELEKYQKAFGIVENLDLAVQSTFQQWFTKRLGINETNLLEKDKDILRYPFYETKLQMDPLFMLSRHDVHMVQQIFERLVEFNPSTGTVMPRIAHHFASEEGKNWTFYLRKGVLFHHGRELTSEDVKATFTRFLSGENIIKNVESIHCISDYVIEFNLKQANYLFPRYLASLKASIIPMDVINKNEAAFQKFPIGSGPYQLVRNDEELVSLDVFEKYYGLRPWLDRIEIIKAPSRFQLEQTHPILLTAPNGSWKKVMSMEEGADFITFNCRKEGPVKERDFRKILYQVIDPKEFCLPEEKLAYSFLTKKPVQQQVSIETETVREAAYDGELVIAAQEIREGVNHEREARILKKQLNNAGISARIELVHAADFKKSQILEKYDLFVSGIALSEDRLLSAIATIQSPQVAIYPCLPDGMKDHINQEVIKMMRIQKEEERWISYFAIEDILVEQHMLLFLNHRSHTVYESEDSEFMNIELDSNGRIDYRKVWRR